jgi:hypothetical protein
MLKDFSISEADLKRRIYYGNDIITDFSILSPSFDNGKFYGFFPADETV